MRQIFVGLIALVLLSPALADEPADVQIKPQASNIPNIKVCQLVTTYRGKVTTPMPLSRFDPAMSEMLGFPDAKVHYFDLSKFRLACGISLMLDSYILQGTWTTTSGTKPLNTIVLRQTRDAIAFAVQEVAATDTWEETYNISVAGF